MCNSVLRTLGAESGTLDSILFLWAYTVKKKKKNEHGPRCKVDIHVAFYCFYFWCRKFNASESIKLAKSVGL